MTALVYAAALPLEMCGLFAVWNWSIKRRSWRWLLIGNGLLTGLLLVPMLMVPALPGRVYLGFAGMYMFSGLMWAWWVDGLDPAEWKLGEIGVAVMSLTMFAIAGVPR